MEGGGADVPALNNGSAWFLGSRTIQVCTMVAPDFAPKTVGIDFSGTLQLVFRRWDTYLTKVGINAHREAGYFIDTHFNLNAGCSGSEDLTVYFGGSNPEIVQAKTWYTNPVAFASRTQFDMSEGWGKGFIWVAPAGSVDSGGFPNWEQADNLTGILLHEFGHVLGCDHVDGTIMEGSIATSLLMRQTDLPGRHARLTQIDGESMLTFDGGVFAGNSVDSATFRKLSGRSPVGKTTTKLQFDFASAAIVLTLSDSKGSAPLIISISAEQIPPFGSVLGNNQGATFRVSKNNASGDPVQYSWGASSAVLSGSLKAMNGKNYPVQLTFNLHGPVTPRDYQVDGPILVRMADPSGWRNVFTMPWTGLSVR